MDGYLSGDVVTLVWVNKTATDESPTTDTVVDLRDCDSYVVQVDSTVAANTSSSIDINVIGCPNFNEATPVWDTVSTQVLAAHGDNQIKSYYATTLVGGHVKFRLDNNTGASRADVTVKVLKRSRRA